MSQTVLAIVKNGKIEPIVPIDLPEGANIIILIDPPTEAIEWSRFSIDGLSYAYDDDEPEYQISQLKEMNSTYEGA